MDTLTEIAVPDIGDFADVPVIEILVAVGDTVAVEDPLVAIESDKATMEIPAPFAGIVREILVSVGDKVSQGTPILRIDGDGAVADDARGSEPERAVDVRPGADTAAGGDVAGDGALVAGAPTDGAGSAAIPGGEVEAPAEPARDWGDVYAGPAVRRQARERGIDLRTVSGSGRRGRITLEDLDRAPVAATGAANGAGGAPGAGVDSLGLAPWLLVAAVPVIIVILAFNFLGDGLRDAADPYG